MSQKKEKNISTEILPSNEEGILRAAQILNSGGLVAFPTETVYGLGADATNAEAIKMLYKTKGRPSKNPLIIHVYDEKIIEELVEMDFISTMLSTFYWPGPLTLVLKKDSNLKFKIDENAISKLKTVAVRIPAHPVARSILRHCKNPIAAPSANMSGKLSTTRFEDVLNCMSGKIDAIVNGGPCPIGLESTIVKIDNGILSVLRPGSITEEEIKSKIGKITNRNDIADERIISPGQFKSHYCPKTPIRLNIMNPRKNELLLSFGPLPKDVKGISLTEISDLDEAAMNLYSALADLDDLAKITHSTSIAINPIPNNGVGVAINDRLERAAYR